MFFDENSGYRDFFFGRKSRYRGFFFSHMSPIRMQVKSLCRNLPIGVLYPIRTQVKSRYPGFSSKKKKKSRYPGFFIYDSPPLGCRSVFFDRKKAASWGGGVCCKKNNYSLVAMRHQKRKKLGNSIFLNKTLFVN